MKGGDNMKGQKGFTLIELLVVIAIIAILAAVVLVALGNARGEARDSSRKADMNSVMTAIELYKTTEASALPGQAACGSADGVFCAVAGTLCSGFTFEGSEQVYIQTLPSDPGDNTYTCTSDGAGNYTVVATLDDDATTFTCQNGSCSE
jgi:general secretion pathway protein G